MARGAEGAEGGEGEEEVNFFFWGGGSSKWKYGNGGEDCHFCEDHVRVYSGL